MTKRKSKTQILDEFATAAANALIIIGNNYEVYSFNVPFFSMLLSSGRIEEATKHLKDGILKTQGIGQK